MDIRELEKIEQQLVPLEHSFDICVTQSADPIRLNESVLKLRDIVRKNTEWRKEVLALLKKIT